MRSRRRTLRRSAGKVEEGAPAVGAAVVPGFDVVRVEPDGSAAVAGTAAPGAKVTVFADQTPLAEAEADAKGNFVAVFKVEPSDAPRALTLGATPPEGGAATSSDDVVMLLPKAPEAAVEPKLAAVAPAGAGRRDRQGRAAARGRAEAATRGGGGGRDAGGGGGAGGVHGGGAGGGGDGDRSGGHRRGAADGGRKDAALSLASISYTDAGQVTLAGVGTAGSVLRAYVDDSFAQEATVGATGAGRWIWAGSPRGSTGSGSISSPPTARSRAGSRRRSSATIRTRRRRGPASRGASGGHGDGAAGQQPLDFGAGALWFGRDVHPDLHRQPRADPQSRT